MFNKMTKLTCSWGAQAGHALRWPHGRKSTVAKFDRHTLHSLCRSRPSYMLNNQFIFWTGLKFNWNMYRVYTWVSDIIYQKYVDYFLIYKPNVCVPLEIVLKIEINHTLVELTVSSQPRVHRPVPLVVVRGFLGCSVVWETGYCRERVALTGTLESDYDACSVCNVCDHPREVLKRFISTFFRRYFKF